MNSHKNPRSTLTEHLDSSIQQVRDNLDAVSFWAHAVSGFSQPIPAYEPDDSNIRFQAVPLTAGPKLTAGSKGRAKSRKTRARH
jgi:hypothetical protein